MSQSSDMSAGWPQQPPQSTGYPQAEWPGQEAEPTYIVDGGESNVPTEFDHLFRGSDQDSRREIDRVAPGIGSVAAGQQSQFGQPQGMVDPQAGYAGYAQPPIDPQQAALFQQQAQAAAAQYEASFQQQATYPPAYADQQQTAQYDGGQQYPQGMFETATADPQYQVPQYQVPGAQYPGEQYGQQQFQPPGQGGPRAGLDPKRKRLLIGGGVAAVVVVALVVAFSGNSPSSKAPQTPAAAATKSLSPKAELDQINNLIAQSGQLRSDANDAVIDINSCTNLATEQTALQSTAQQRAMQAASVAKIATTGIPQGAELVQQLQAAWTASSAYDAAYAKIAGDLQGGCTKAQVKKDPNYAATNQQASAADNAKAQAAQLWNANAVPLGESKVTADKL